MAILATDTFDRADVNPLAGNWTTGNGETAMQIVSNVATPSTTVSDCSADYTGIAWPANQFSRAKLATTGSGGADSGNVLKTRSATGAHTYYRLVLDHAAANNVNLSRMVAGVATTLTGWPVTQAWTDGDTWELRVIGTTLQVFRNGSQVGPTTTDSNIATGNPGIGYSSASTGVSHNDWEGGSADVGAFPYGTRRPPAKAGPYDPKGFLLSNYTRFDYTPSVVSNAVTVVTGVGSLVLDGFAPAIGTPVTVVPGFGSLILTGNAPTFPTTLLPGFGQLTLTGFSPAIGVPVTVVPGFGQLILTGLSPTFPRTIIPGFGSLVLNGFAPTFPYTLLPGLGSLVLNGFSPSFALAVQPGTGLLVITGFAPTIGVPVTVVPGAGSLSLSGLAPTFPQTLRPGSGLLTLTGFGPSFSFTAASLARAIAQSLGTDALVSGSSSSATLIQNSGLIAIVSSDSKTIQLITGNSGVISLDSDG